MEKPLNVACPEPVTLTVTACVLVSGVGVPVGIPNESSPGETETDVTGSGAGTADASLDAKLTSRNVRVITAVTQMFLFLKFMRSLSDQQAF
jgi:hypothetical protein